MVVYDKPNYITVIIDDKGFIRANELSTAFYSRIDKFLKDEETIETIECLQGLGQKEININRNHCIENHNGFFINPFLALQLASIKKNEDIEYVTSFEFLRNSIFEWIEQNNKQNEFEFLYDFYNK